MDVYRRNDKILEENMKIAMTNLLFVFVLLASVGFAGYLIYTLTKSPKPTTAQIDITGIPQRYIEQPVG